MTDDRVIVIEESRSSAFRHPRVWDATELIGGEARLGGKLVTFDRINFLNMFSDYPEKFTAEQIEIIREERPYWFNFFRERLDKTLVE